MAMKAKTFDCVSMKNKAQEEIAAEWEARKDEFASYAEFLEATVKESEWGRQVWGELHRSKSPGSGQASTR
jgi:hypothetical protein